MEHRFHIFDTHHCCFVSSPGKDSETDSIDDASDSDAEDTASVKAFIIPEDRRSWKGTGLEIDDDYDTNSIIGNHGRRGAVSSEGQPSALKKNAIKSKISYFPKSIFLYKTTHQNIDRKSDVKECIFA